MRPIRVRLFAAARAAAGIGEVTVEVADDATLGDVLAAIVAAHSGLADVIARCSFLGDGVAVTDRARPFAGSQLDVLPPFAGG
ncbi:MAG TPA: MoaD/ThiS family protein [Galbitalea sp.]